MTDLGNRDAIARIARPSGGGDAHLLRTLAPALRRLDERLRAWLAAPKRKPLPTLAQASLDGLSADLQRSAGVLDLDRPLLQIMFMGGTGVGKSTLLNALAKAPVAHASFARPTTRDPVVYYHESIKPDRLDPALRQCKLVAHNRPGLEHKILVDTPDLDSNELANRDKLLQLLRVADVVLYVGSQEKYHDKLGWELFLENRKRRAFAFVLNKWDRCLHGSTNGSTRPDEDLLRDLREEGFENPLLFRTCAQGRVDGNGVAIPDGEQFPELERWLEAGLTRLEIEAIKARGVSQLLQQMEGALAAAKPPDLKEAATRTQKVWRQALEDEAHRMADLLLATIEPYQHDIAQHFAMEGHRRFRGPMATFLHAVTRLRFLGTTLRSKIPRPLRGDAGDTNATTAWDMQAFSKACSNLASERHLDARGRALPNHLLVQADQEGFPVSLLSDPAEEASRSGWRQRFAAITLEVLTEVESQWVRPTGSRRWIETILILIGDGLPFLVFIGSYVWLGYAWIWGNRPFGAWDLLLPFAVVLVLLVVLYAVISILLPLRWPSIRGAFQRQLAERLEGELTAVYLNIPRELAEALALERRAVDQLLDECHEVADWLRAREETANVGALYGK